MDHLIIFRPLSVDQKMIKILVPWTFLTPFSDSISFIFLKPNYKISNLSNNNVKIYDVHQGMDHLRIYLFDV